MAGRRWDRASVDGVELEYEAIGTGEPVVLIHNGVGVSWFEPLLNERTLADRYRLVTYHRAGFAGSGRVDGAIDFAQETAHCRSLMRHLGIERAHIVGHSSSAMMALQMALDAPDAVHTLVLLEPGLLALPSPPEVPASMEIYRTGDRAAAVATFLRGSCGPNARAELDRALPNAFDEAVASADRFFGQELPALRKYSFGPDEAKRVTQPALVVLGTKSSAIHRQRRDLLLGWLPNGEPFDLAGATHLLHVHAPRGMADGLAAFLARHPMSVAT